jgi:hypothetical protein
MFRDGLLSSRSKPFAATRAWSSFMGELVSGDTRQKSLASQTSLALAYSAAWMASNVSTLSKLSKFDPYKDERSPRQQAPPGWNRAHARIGVASMSSSRLMSSSMLSRSPSSHSVGNAGAGIGPCSLSSLHSFPRLQGLQTIRSLQSLKTLYQPC